MAGNYKTGDDTGSYSNPQFTTQRTHLARHVGASASSVSFAHFRSRNKVLVSRVSLVCISAPSLTSGTLKVYHVDTGATATALFTLTLASCIAGYATTMAFTGKTLGTLTEAIALQTEQNESGDWDVLVEYQLLYPVSYA